MIQVTTEDPETSENTKTSSPESKKLQIRPLKSDKKKKTRIERDLQVGDDDAIKGVVEGRPFFRHGDKREIGVSAAVEIAHVHPTVEHDSLPIDRHHHAALSHLLPCACKNMDLWISGQREKGSETLKKEKLKR